MKKHLWDVDHSFYCEQHNYFNRSGEDQPTEFAYKSWSDFLEEMGEASMDLNLLFRWDWQEDDRYGVKQFNGDPNDRNGLLLLFFMAQGKGFHTCARIDVCRADEPAVIEYLIPRLKHLQSLWAPLLDAHT